MKPIPPSNTIPELQTRNTNVVQDSNSDDPVNESRIGGLVTNGDVESIPVEELNSTPSSSPSLNSSVNSSNGPRKRNPIKQTTESTNPAESTGTETDIPTENDIKPKRNTRKVQR